MATDVKKGKVEVKPVKPPAIELGGPVEWHIAKEGKPGERRLLPLERAPPPAGTPERRLRVPRWLEELRRIVQPQPIKPPEVRPQPIEPGQPRPPERVLVPLQEVKSRGQQPAEPPPQPVSASAGAQEELVVWTDLRGLYSDLRIYGVSDSIINEAVMEVLGHIPPLGGGQPALIKMDDAEKIKDRALTIRECEHRKQEFLPIIEGAKDYEHMIFFCTKYISRASDANANLLMQMLLNININSKGLCTFSGSTAYLWGGFVRLSIPVSDTHGTLDWCKSSALAAITHAYGDNVDWGRAVRKNI